MKKSLSVLSITMLVASTGIVSFANPALEESNTVPTVKIEESIENNMDNTISPRITSYVVTANNVRMRKNPGTSSTIIKNLQNGNIVNRSSSAPKDVVKDGYTWKYVSHGNTYGWVASKYLQQIG